MCVWCYYYFAVAIGYRLGTRFGCCPKIYGRAEWRAGAWNFRSARMFALYFVLIPMITILFFVAHKACWFFQFLLNYFDTLNISFLFVFFSVVYFIMFQLTITWFCLRYDFMFTKMFLFCQRLLRNSSYVSPLSLQPTLPTEYLMCVLVFPIPYIQEVDSTVLMNVWLCLQCLLWSKK